MAIARNSHLGHLLTVTSGCYGVGWLLPKVTLVVKEHRFNIYGKLIAVAETTVGWRTFFLGADGKRRPAEIVVPVFVAEDELLQYLADLFHESATPSNGEPKRLS